MKEQEATARQGSVELVVVDRVQVRDAPEIARLLKSARLHPSYEGAPRHMPNTLPTHAVFAKADIRVPAHEAAAAQAVLNDYYADANERINRHIRRWRRAMILPGICGVCAAGTWLILEGEFVVALGVGVLGFVAATFVQKGLMKARQR